MVPILLLSSAGFLLFAYFVFRIVIKRDYERKNGLSSIAYLLEILVFAVHANLIYLNSPVPWPEIPDLPDNAAVKIVAAIVFILGVLLLLVAWFGLGTKVSLGKDENQLNTSGVYSYSRNPQLVAYGIILFSIAILFPSDFMPAWLLLYVAASYFMVKSEEEFLARKYGEIYEAYCQSVPRVLF